MKQLRSAHHTVASAATAAAALAAALCLGWWLGFDPTSSFVAAVPGTDGSPSPGAGDGSDEVVTIGEFFARFNAEAPPLPGSWPRFRGADFDNISAEQTRLLESWAPDGPPVLWQVTLGEGHAAPAVSDGRVYVLDYDETERADSLRCFALADGRELWRRWYSVRLKRNHGLSRTVPAVSGSRVVTIGPRCHVMCVDAETGDLQWTLDMERAYGAVAPFWYTGQCPLVDGDVAVLAPAGSALMIGVDAAAGTVLWETPNPGGWQMSHTSVMPMTLAGRDMYVYSAVEGMVAVAADGEARGQVLWQTTLWSQAVLAPSPVILPDGRIFVTAGYGAGSMMLRVRPEGQGFVVDNLQEYKPDQGMASEQQTPLLYDGRLFGIQPKDAGALRNQLVCCDPDDCTTPVWTSGKTARFGLGPYLIADGKLLVLDDDGTLTMAEASTSGYRELARAQILDGVDAWGPMVVAGGRLLLRDATRMVCVDLRAEGSQGGAG